jgi:hypothetical protein
MNAKRRLKHRIHGWIPKDSVAVYQCTPTRPTWWKSFWSAAWVYTLVLGLVGFLALRIPLWYVSVIGGYLAIIGSVAALYSLIKHSSISRVLYIFLGMTTFGLLLSVAYTFLLGHYATAWLSGSFNLIVIIGIQIAGGVVGDLIGKQRNYQALPLGFDDNAQTSRMSERDKAIKLKVVSVLLGALGVCAGGSAAGYAYVFFVGIGATSYDATVYAVILWLFVIAVFWVAALNLKRIQQYITKEAA